MDAPARPDIGPAGASMLLRLVGGQVLVVVAALFAAGVLTSLAPPARALAKLGSVDARVGPGPVSHTVRKGQYDVKVAVTPNRAAVPNSFTVKVTRAGRPLRGADVTARFTMLDMEMTPLAYNLPEQSPGTFSRSAPALVMVGRWGLGLNIRPRGGAPFDVLMVDHASG
jgi:copper transport protein